MNSIVLCGKTVTYRLERKAVKNINLRISPNGDITVSAPPKATVKEIEDVFERHAARILVHLEEAAKNTRQPCRFLHGETVRILGEDVPLTLRQGKKNTAVFEEGVFTLTVTDPTDVALKKRVFDAWRKRETQRLVTALCHKWYPTFEKYIPQFPTLTFRFMTSRYGSCRPKAARMTFHAGLVDAPLDCVELVVVHELVHFIHPNHSAAFYETLSRCLPDHRERKTRLRNCQKER